MAADRILQINSSGDIAEYVPISTSAGAASANKVPVLNASGLIDNTMLPNVEVSTYTASENIAAGAFINTFLSGGVTKVRNADASAALAVEGFALAAITSGAAGPINTSPSSNTSLTGLTIGSMYFLGNVGAVTTVVNTTAGQICQKVGRAKSATEIEWLPYVPVTRA